MNSCESCHNENPFYIQRAIENTFISHGINMDLFCRSLPKDRLDLIENNFKLNDLPDIRDKNTNEINSNIGLVVVKPEMYKHHDLVEEYIQNKLDIQIEESKEFIYTPEQYWQTYQDLFKNSFETFPHITLLMLNAIVSPSRLIVFKHNQIIRYNEKYKELTKKEIKFIPSESDPQLVFNKLFIKDPDISIRNKICTPVLRNEGFDKFDSQSCIAKYWDFTGTFIQRSAEQNERTFNGIHSPNNNAELQKAIAIYNI